MLFVINLQDYPILIISLQILFWRDCPFKIIVLFLYFRRHCLFNRRARFLLFLLPLNYLLSSFTADVTVSLNNTLSFFYFDVTVPLKDWPPGWCTLSCRWSSWRDPWGRSSRWRSQTSQRYCNKNGFAKCDDGIGDGPCSRYFMDLKIHFSSRYVRKVFLEYWIPLEVQYQYPNICNICKISEVEEKPSRRL
jgi:hypothetical protein